MSQENIEIVRSVVEPLNDVNVAPLGANPVAVREILASAYSPEVELSTLPSGLGSGVGQFYRGWDGMVSYLKGMARVVHGVLRRDPRLHRGRRLRTRSHPATRVGSGSGIKVEIELTTLYGLRDGLITRMEQYDTVQAAREAAGPA